MPEYIYRAIDEHGAIFRNRVEADSKHNLIRKLKANALMPIDVVQVSYGKKKKVKRRNNPDIDEIMKTAKSATVLQGNKISTREKINLSTSIGEKVTNRDLMIFTQNFYLLKKANFNNVHALSTIIQSTENSTLRGILQDILAGIEGGDYMYPTMEYYSDTFPYIYINLIKVGELSGSLTESLEQAITYLDSSDSLTKKVKRILIPNIAQFVVLLAILFFGCLYVIPTIQDVFDKVGTKDKLPEITVWFSNFLQAVATHWYIPIGLIAIIAGVIIWYINTPKGKYNFHAFKYHMPIFGKLIFSLDFSRFSKAMLLNLRNGMRIQEALEVSKNVTKNYVFLSIIETSINNILMGESWVEPFERSGLASSMITEMLKIGMQTDLPEMMDKLVEYMEIDINNTLDKIVKVLPELTYSIVGIVIIFITLVVLVPCIEVYMGNFLFSAAGV